MSKNSGKNSDESKEIQKKEKPKIVNMFDKFEKALEMDEKGTPRSTIITELDISSATFYKWIKNPSYWSEQYKTRPERLMRTTKTIIRSVKSKENSVDTIRGLLKDLQLNEYELEFMYNYIEKRNSTEALLRTLPPNLEVSRQTAKIKALKLMQRRNIREGIDRILQWELEGIHVSLSNDIVGTLYRMAFYDPAMFIDGEGNSRFRSLDDIPPEYRCCVVGIKPIFHPKDPKAVRYEIKLADRAAAMRELSEYSNLYESNNQGLKSIGDGLKKMASILESNKVGTIEGVMENVTPDGVATE